MLDADDDDNDNDESAAQRLPIVLFKLYDLNFDNWVFTIWDIDFSLVCTIPK